jgi:hypothetical protein
MEGLPEVPQAVWTATSVLFAVTSAAVGCVALARFRATLSGLLLGGVYLLSALLTSATLVFSLLVVPRLGGLEIREAVYRILGLTHVLLSLLIALGIALIPASLRRPER